MTTHAAARVGDGILHTPTRLRDGLTLAGMVIGGLAAAKIAAVAGSAGALAGAVAVAVGAVSAREAVVFVGSWAQRLGALLSPASSASGRITRGAMTVTINRREAARAHRSTEVSCHRAHVRTGCDTVFHERSPASRIGDDTTCGGAIGEGSSDVGIAGGVTDTDGRPVTTRLEEPRTWVALGLDASKLLTVRRNAWSIVEFGYNAWRLFGGAASYEVEVVLGLNALRSPGSLREQLDPLSGTAADAIQSRPARHPHAPPR